MESSDVPSFRGCADKRPAIGPDGGERSARPFFDCPDEFRASDDLLPLPEHPPVRINISLL